MSTKTILQEQLRQEQQKREDRAYYNMLIALAAALVIEFALITLYRRYSAGENYRPVLRIVMWAFLGITALSGVAFVYSAITKKFNYLKPLLAIGGVFFGCAVILRLTNILGIWAVTALNISCIAVPVVLLLYFIYQIYPVEFFMSALFGSLGILTMWVARKVFYIRYFKRLYVMAGVVLLLVILAALTYMAMKNKGYIGKGNWRFRLFSPKTSYKSLYLTYGITLGLFIIYLLTETIFYPVIIPFMAAFAIYIFVMAIYYTIKLM